MLKAALIAVMLIAAPAAAAQERDDFRLKVSETIGLENLFGSPSPDRREYALVPAQSSGHSPLINRKIADWITALGIALLAYAVISSAFPRPRARHRRDRRPYRSDDS